MATAVSDRRRPPRRGRAVAGVAIIVALAAAAALWPRSDPARAFAWLAPAAPPAGWSVAHATAGEAELARPPGWRRVRSDRGAVSVVLPGRGSVVRGYLNATPRQGAETLRNWGAFRVAHNADEGDRGVRLIAARRNLRFRSGPGACVQDAYATGVAHYREIACLVRGRGGAEVVVGAAPATGWAHQAPVIERAISAFVA
jgi:hypothetical protein